MRTLIVPLDGSSLGEAALPWATLLAQRLGLSLTLTRVVAVGRASAELGPHAQQAQASPSWREAARYLARIERDLRAKHIDVVMEVRAGLASPNIVDLAAERDAVAIVMTTHGRGAVGRILLGSVAEEVLRESSVPVWIVPAAKGAATAPRLSTIGVMLDGSSLAESALPCAADLARAGAKLLLLRVVPPVERAVASPFAERDVDEAATDEAVTAAEAYLGPVRQRLQAEGIDVRGEVVRGTPAEGIREAVVSFGLDAIVMTTHGYSGLDRLRLGSVAREVVRGSAVPVGLISRRALLAQGSAGRRVRDLMNRDVLILELDEPVDSAARRMLARGVHAAAVVGSDGALCGVLGVRDLLAWHDRAVRDAADPGTIRVLAAQATIADLVPARTITIDDSATLDDAQALFREQRVESVVVVRNNRPVGILAIHDVLQASASSWLHPS
ncbi:MAG TPA: universal stress protein [Chloroflexota bacterium]|nr:universal stress protein [Chloroflexota bacterium]